MFALDSSPLPAVPDECLGQVLPPSRVLSQVPGIMGTLGPAGPQYEDCAPGQRLHPTLGKGKLYLVTLFLSCVQLPVPFCQGSDTLGPCGLVIQGLQP